MKPCSFQKRAQMRCRRRPAEALTSHRVCREAMPQLAAGALLLFWQPQLSGRWPCSSVLLSALQPQWLARKSCHTTQAEPHENTHCVKLHYFCIAAAVRAVTVLLQPQTHSTHRVFKDENAPGRLHCWGRLPPRGFCDKLSTVSRGKPCTLSLPQSAGSPPVSMFSCKEQHSN